jgi:hypothetical protein
VLERIACFDDAPFQVGVKHVKFWNIENGVLKGKKGALGKFTEAQTVTCVDFIRSTTADGAFV